MSIFFKSKSIFSMLRNRSYHNLFGVVNMTAAQRCLSDIESITSRKEKNELVLSAITLFRSAESSYNLKAKKSFSKHLNVISIGHARTMQIFMWCQIAMCEKYLGNVEKMNLALNAAFNIENNSEDVLILNDFTSDLLDSENSLKQVAAVPLTLFSVGVLCSSMIVGFGWNSLTSKEFRNSPLYYIDLKSFQQELKNK